MLSLFLTWVLCAFTFISFGKLLINISNYFLKGNTYGWGDTFFLGMAFTGTIISLLSIWFPVNNLTGWGLVVAAIIYCIYLHVQKKDYFLLDIFERVKSLPLTAKYLIITVFVVVTIFNLLPPFITDAGLYYLQTILWNESYPVVPGLGNIHGRFGFNSNILLLSSAFSFSGLFSMRIFGLLGLSMIVFLSWVITKMVESRSLLKIITLCFFSLAFFYCYRSFISSSSTDILPNILVGFVLLRIILDKNALKESPLTFWIIPIYALTLKLSIIPLCIFCLFLFIRFIKEKQFVEVGFLCFTGLLILTPWIARNIILTGYLVYPFPVIDIFDFDWKIPKQMVEIEKTWVSSWAKMPGLNYQEVENMPLVEWGKVWLLRHVKYFKLPLFTCFLAFLSPLAMLWVYIRKKEKNISEFYPWVIAFSGFIFWLLLAPDTRFGFSFILISALAPLLISDFNIKKKIYAKLCYCLYALILLLIAVESQDLYKKYKGEKSLASFLYTPQSVEVVKDYFNIQYVQHTIGTTVIYTPVSSEICFDHTIPCVPHWSGNLMMRGESIEEGFRFRNQEDK